MHRQKWIDKKGSLLLRLGRGVAEQPAFGALDGGADIADAHDLWDCNG